MARLSDLILARLAALLAPAGAVVRPRAAALGLPAAPASGDTAAWRTWLAALGEEALASLLEALPPNEEFPPATATLRAPDGHVESTDEPPYLVLKTTKLGSGFPIVDRLDVWANLNSLRRGDARILQIRGPGRVGKTYVRWIVQEFCNRLGPGHEVRYLNLEGVLSLKQIATHIAAGLGITAPLIPFDESDATTSAWARALADQVFVLITSQAPQVRWLVFDHFERAKRKDAILFFDQFTEQVALAVDNPNLPNGPRLVLIDHGVELSDVAANAALEADLRIVGVRDVERFVRSCATLNANDAAAKAEALHAAARAAANGTIAELQAADPANPAVPIDPFMELLYRELRGFLRDLAAPRGTAPGGQP